MQLGVEGLSWGQSLFLLLAEVGEKDKGRCSKFRMEKHKITFVMHAVIREERLDAIVRSYRKSS